VGEVHEGGGGGRGCKYEGREGERKSEGAS
jgi:hypothetical protein